MREEWQAHIEELLEEYRKKRSDLTDLQGRMASVEATVISEDGMVTVTVGPQGRLVGLELNPRVYRKLSSQELAEAVLAGVREATAQVGEQMRDVLEPFVPEGGSYSDVMQGGLDLSKMLPERIDDMDELLAKYGFRPKE